MNPTRSRPDPTRQLGRAVIGALVTMAGAAVGCGQQAGADYLGQPLLSMRGQATVSALTDGQAVVPALCFFNTVGPAPAFDENKLPADMRSDLAYAFPSLPFPSGPPQTGTSILDVQSHGEFPAQFDIDVYLPPIDAALSPPLFAGEPRFVSGNVCGVSADHAALTHQLDQWLIVRCSDATACYRELLLASYDTPRFYFERYDCPIGDGSEAGTRLAITHLFSSDLSDCSHTTGGDQTLAYEITESVLGTSSDITLVYLASPAAAGSYTAWQYGSRTGLSAGYHLFANAPEAAPDSTCLSDATTDALTMIQAQYEPEIKRMYGDSYVLNMFPVGANGADGIKPLPADVISGGERILAQLQMQRCPPLAIQEIDPATTNLSVVIEPLGSKHELAPSQVGADVPRSMP